MGLISDIFNRTKIINIDGTSCDLISAEMCIYELALDNVAAFIGNSLVQSKIVTYDKGKVKKDNMYYLFNVKPNKNENATEWKKKIAYKLVFDNEVLIFQNKEELFIADSFDESDDIFKQKIYSNITVEDISLKKGIKTEDCLHIKLNNNKTKKVLDCVYSLHGKALARAYKQFYKQRGLFMLSNNVSFGTTDQEEIKQIMTKKVSDYYGEKDTAVMTLENGLGFEDKSKNEVKYEDIDQMIEKVFTLVFNAYGVPLNFMKEASTTSATKSSSGIMDQYLSMCINPLATLIETEINAKFYTKKQYLERTYIKIRTHNVKHNSPLESATNIDILRRNGFNFNEIMEYLGEEEINEKWATERYITKNYEKMN